MAFQVAAINPSSLHRAFKVTVTQTGREMCVGMLGSLPLSL